MDWLTARVDDAARADAATALDGSARDAPQGSAPNSRWRAVLVAIIVVALVPAGIVAAFVTGGGGAADVQVDEQPQASAAPAASPSQPAPTATAPTPPGTAVAALETLNVKGRAPKTGYDRDAWQVWSDGDGNGCLERQDVLDRDLTDVQRVGCEVVGGTLVDPYTGKVITVPTADPQIDVDHVVALSDAWQKGAAGWSPQQQQAFASDQLNLLAVSSSANRSKSDGDAATWLPPNKAYRCDYVARQIAVKQKYGLWVTQAEHDAMARVLSTCPSQPLPVQGQATTPVQPIDQGSGPPAGTVVDPALDPQFPSCKALLAAGYPGGYVRGADPEYEWYRDGDGDGVVCE